jgi:hypothetical protein
MTITYGWKLTKYDIEEDSIKQMKLIRHFHPCCEFHAYVSLSLYGFHSCVIKFVHVESSIYFINFIQILPTSSSYLCPTFFLYVRVSFICHQFIHVENVCLFYPKKIPQMSFSFMWWTSSSICVPFSCPYYEFHSQYDKFIHVGNLSSNFIQFHLIFTQYHSWDW